MRVLSKLGVFIRELVQGDNPTGNTVSCGVVAANDQEDDIAQEQHRVVDHVFGVFSMGQHGDQVKIRFCRSPFLPELHEGACTSR